MKRIALDLLLGSEEHLGSLRELVSIDGVAAIPTETFYGLAANPFDRRAVGRVFEVKSRPAEKALPVLFADRAALRRFGVEAPPEVLERFLALWPAPLTVIFSIHEPVACSGGDRSLAVRMPAHEGLLALLAKTGPLTGTSANPSGMPPLSDPNEVALAFEGKIDLLIDGGSTPGYRSSTLVDARFDPPRLVREGAFAWPPAEKR